MIVGPDHAVQEIMWRFQRVGDLDATHNRGDRRGRMTSAKRRTRLRGGTRIDMANFFRGDRAAVAY